MIQHLHLDRLILEVLELVSHDELVRARHGRDAGLHADLGAEDARLVDVPFDDDFVRRQRRRRAPPRTRRECWRSGRAARTWCDSSSRRASSSRPRTGRRCSPVRTAPAARQTPRASRGRHAQPRFTNAGFTGPSSIGESQPRRFPSIPALPETHPAGRHHREAKRTVVHDDQVDAFAPAPPQGVLLDRERLSLARARAQAGRFPSSQPTRRSKHRSGRMSAWFTPLVLGPGLLGRICDGSPSPKIWRTNASTGWGCPWS